MNRNYRNLEAANVDCNRELGRKIEISEFDRQLDPDAFFDWLIYVESVFSHKEMIESHKVSPVAT